MCRPASSPIKGLRGVGARAFGLGVRGGVFLGVCYRTNYPFLGFVVNSWGGVFFFFPELGGVMLK